MNAPMVPENRASMTSREIAELVGPNHSDVKRSIERLAERGVIELPPTAQIPTATKPTTVYLFTAETKRDSYIVVAQLSPEFTARLVDRWQELESQSLKPALPDFTNPAEAARAWASEYEHKQAAMAQLQAAQPAIEFHARVTQSQDLLSIREAAKLLRTGERRLFGFLRREGLLMASNLPYQNFMDRGLFRLVETPWTDPLGRARVSVKTCLTQKGLVYVQGLQDRLALYQDGAA